MAKAKVMITVARGAVAKEAATITTARIMEKIVIRATRAIKAGAKKAMTTMTRVVKAMARTVTKMTTIAKVGAKEARTIMTMVTKVMGRNAIKTTTTERVAKAVMEARTMAPRATARTATKAMTMAKVIA